RQGRGAARGPPAGDGGLIVRSNLVQRLLAALVACPLLLALLYLGPAWGWAAFIAAATAVGAIALFGMRTPGDRVSRAVGLALTLGTYGALWSFTSEPRALIAVLFLLPLCGMLLTLARLGDMQTAALRVFAATAGPLYLGGGMSAL